ncbi:MAG: ABC transporter permease family protein [Aggregatilineales bacterium]
MFRIFDPLQLAFERLWNNRILVLWVLVGLSVATTLAVSLPMYVDAVDSQLLISRLPDPPYAFRFRYLGTWKGNIGTSDVTSATTAVDSSFTQTIGLPVTRAIHYMRGGVWPVQMTDASSLGSFSLGTLDGAAAQMKIVAGQWPPTPTKPGDPIPILIPESAFYGMGLQVGDPLTIASPNGTAIALKIVAQWQPINPDDPSWIFTPTFFDNIFLCQKADLLNALNGLDKPIEEAAWYVLFNGAQVRTSDIDGLLGRMTDGQRLMNAVLPGIRLDVQPADGLTAFSKEVAQLTQQLVTVMLPVGGLVLYFVSMIAGLLVSRQRTEDVTLRSRGISRWGVFRIHGVMWLILAGISLLVGLAAAPTVIYLVGQTTSFLRFDNADAPLSVIFTPVVLMTGVLTALLAASSGLYLAWRATRQTITQFKQQSARLLAAWWQRVYLDVLLLIPAYYALYTLSRHGGIVSSAEDPFSNPITFLGPTLFALGNTLLFLRLWPMLLRFFAQITLRYGRSIAVLMALRELTRSIGRYRGGLLMMCFTLSLSAFTASMASTIDRSLVDSVNYRIGADVVLVTASSARLKAASATTKALTGFNTLPATDLLTVPGVAQISRIGRYAAQLILPDQILDGVILGVDRGSIASIARFRSDYATMPVANLFNLLAGHREGVLLSAATAQKYNLQIGQEITYQLNVLNTQYQTTVPIVGLLNYFPTLDPTTQFFMVANIDPIWELVGTELPHDVWISVKPGTSITNVEAAVHAKGFPVIQWLDAKAALHAAQTSPSRRGVLGFLSVGFIASIVLTLVGTVIQSTASFRAQMVQIGALRAMGLRSLSVGVYLILSQGLATLGGIGGGTLIGALSTLLFLPLLDFSGGLPPYLVRVAWNNILSVYLVFAGVLFGVTLLTTVLLSRQQLSTIVKLGESI